MIIFRFIALIFIVAALMVLGHDALSSLANGGVVQMISLEGVWGLLHAESLTATKDWLTATGGESVSGVTDTIFAWPAFAVLGVLGVLLAILFRPRED